MAATLDIADRAATLAEADPGLVRAVGRRNAAGFAHRRILPVLAVAPGAWTPPAAGRLGRGTFALAVLDGLITEQDGGLQGPGDMIVPWGSHWVACTPVRLAVIGSDYLEPLSRWPAAQRRVRARLTAPPSGGRLEVGGLDERLLALLWWIALRWGSPREAGLALPPGLDERALSLLLDTRQANITLALAALRERGVGAARDGAIWLAAGPDSEARSPRRGEALRARAAVQLALARAACEDCADLCDDLDLALGRRAALRRHGESSGRFGQRAADPDQLVQPGDVDRSPRRAVRADDQ